MLIFREGVTAEQKILSNTILLPSHTKNLCSFLYKKSIIIKKKREQCVCDTLISYLVSRSIHYLANCIGENVNYLLMRSCYNTLSIDLNDAMTYSYTTSLCDPTSHKAANLQIKKNAVYAKLGSFCCS